MTINIILEKNRTIKCDTSIIGKTYENESTILKFNLTKEMKDKEFYLDFEKADGTKFVTPRLDIKTPQETEEIVTYYVEYKIPNSLLDIKGELKCEVVLRNSDNQVWKSYTLKFNVLDSINASEEIPEQYPDFVLEAQKVIDLIDTTGNGTMYLSNDGTYKEVSDGTQDYNKLNNIPIKYITGSEAEPIYFNSLETGIYILNGTFQPYENADLTETGENILLQVMKLDNYVSLMYDDLSNNEIEYFKVMIDGSSYESFIYDLANFKQNEKIIISSRTTISTTLYDNYNYQVSTEPTRILLNFPSSRDVGFRCWFVFKTGETIPTFSCDYDIKWHGDSVTDNKLIIKDNKSYTIEFWQDVNNFNAEVREV